MKRNERTTLATVPLFVGRLFFFVFALRRCHADADDALVFLKGYVTFRDAREVGFELVRVGGFLFWSETGDDGKI